MNLLHLHMFNVINTSIFDCNCIPVCQNKNKYYQNHLVAYLNKKFHISMHSNHKNMTMNSTKVGKQLNDDILKSDE